jgi:hypothetical membrane protein
MTTAQRSGLAGITDFPPLRRLTSAGSAVARRTPGSRDADPPIAWWAFACSALIPLILISAWLIAGALQADPYSPTRQTISALAGHGGSHRWIVTLALIAVGPCYFAVAAGLKVLRRPARIALVVSGVASIGIALCPEPAVGTTTEHLICTAIGASSIAVWPALTAQRDSPASTLMSAPVAIAATLVFLAMLGWLVMEAQSGGSSLGLVERLDSSIQIAWPFVVALTVRRPATG